MRTIDGPVISSADDPRFTGSVSGTHFAPDENPQLHAYLMRFEPSGRTAWHSHEHGQLIVCTKGSGYVGTRDGAILELGPGTAVWTDPGQEHWHGAGPASPLTHVAIQTETAGADAVRWFEPVTTMPWETA